MDEVFPFVGHGGRAAGYNPMLFMCLRLDGLDGGYIYTYSWRVLQKFQTLCEYVQGLMRSLGDIFGRT